MKIRSMLALPIGIFVILIASYLTFLWLTYIDDIITSGSGYGFNIGENKKESYDKLPQALSSLKGHGNSIFIQIKVSEESAGLLATKPDYSIMIEPLFHDVGFKTFSEKESWEFYINASFFNSIRLEFCEDKLCKIYRHRKYFEIP